MVPDNVINKAKMKCKLVQHVTIYPLQYLQYFTSLYNTALILLDCFIDDHGIETIVTNIINQAQSYHSHLFALNGSLELVLASYDCAYAHRGVNS